MKRDKLLILLIGVCLVLALVAVPFMSACAPEEEVEKPPVKIAGEWYTTGGLKSHGDMTARGVLLAVKQINEAGGILGGRQIELTIYDEGTTADAATAAAKKAVADGNVAVIGGSDASGMFAWQKVLRDAGIPYAMCCGSNRAMLDPGRFAFEGCIHPTLFPEVSEVALINWFIETKGAKTMALFAFDVEWGRDLLRVLTEWYARPDTPDLEIIGSYWFPIDQPTCELETAKVVEANPDFIYAGIWSASSEVSFLETTYRLGYKGGRAFPPDSMLDIAVEEAGVAADGAVETIGYLPNPSPESHAFDEAFVAEYGYLAAAFSEVAYEAAMIMLMGIDEAGTDSDLGKIAAGIRSVDWVCPRGFKISVSKYGQVFAATQVIAEGRDGKIVALDEVDLPPPEEWPLP